LDRAWSAGRQCRRSRPRHQGSCAVPTSMIGLQSASGRHAPLNAARRCRKCRRARRVLGTNPRLSREVVDKLEDVAVRCVVVYKGASVRGDWMTTSSRSIRAAFSDFGALIGVRCRSGKCRRLRFVYLVAAVVCDRGGNPAFDSAMFNLAKAMQAQGWDDGMRLLAVTESALPARAAPRHPMQAAIVRAVARAQCRNQPGVSGARGRSRRYRRSETPAASVLAELDSLVRPGDRGLARRRTSGRDAESLTRRRRRGSRRATRAFISSPAVWAASGFSWRAILRPPRMRTSGAGRPWRSFRRETSGLGLGRREMGRLR
jgi:hypothetical protein